MKKILAIAAAAALCLGLTACGADGSENNLSGSDSGESLFGGDFNYNYGDTLNYNYGDVIENGFSDVQKNPSSYFSLDRNTATYSLVRTQLNSDYYIYPDSIRIEEMINYFDYDFPAPADKAVGISGYLADCPWNEESKLMLAGIKTTQSVLADANANYVFLIDVSGSMSGDSRLGLAKKGLNLLVEELGESDVLSIVTYASGVSTLLDGKECTAENKSAITKAISSLNAYGSTNGSGGLQRAYSIAQEHFITGGNNRVIIITDGDFNVGISNQNDLKEFIQEKAESGVYLSVLGVGMGNLRDDLLETLARCGNGNYAYLDSETEVRKVFIDDMKGTLITVAKDAKAGVTFTDAVAEYRLIGYDTKIISEDDFNNENADTGEIGSNLCVAALYEIKLADGAEGKLADVEVRYKDVASGETNESVSVGIDLSTPSSDDLAFVSCVAEFGLILRQSDYKGNASLSSVLERLTALSEYISGDAYKEEFVTLVGKATENSENYR